MRYEYARPGYWYCYAPTGWLYFISNAEKLNRKLRKKVLSRSLKHLQSLGYRCNFNETYQQVEQLIGDLKFQRL